jgi:hypothetical protein
VSDAAGTGQWSYGDPFINIYVGSWGYWTSTSVTGDEVAAYKVSLVTCDVGIPAGKIASQAQLWPVKGSN